MSKGQLTRDRIVAAAAPVFNQKGYAGTSLSDLMEATGLEKGGIYRHFDSKQALAEDAFEYAWRVANAKRFDGLDELPDAIDKLKHFIISFRDRRDGLVPGGCPLLNTAVDADDSNPGLKARARHALEHWVTQLQTIILEGQRDHQVHRDIDPVEQSQLIISTLEGALVLSRLTHAMGPLETACKHLLRHLETFRMPQPRRTPPQKSRRQTSVNGSAARASSTQSDAAARRRRGPS